jgi:hypothetical protein
VNDLITIDAVTTSALGFWTVEAAEPHTWDPRPQCFPPPIHRPIDKPRR